MGFSFSPPPFVGREGEQKEREVAWGHSWPHGQSQMMLLGLSVPKMELMTPATGLGDRTLKSVH